MLKELVFNVCISEYVLISLNNASQLILPQQRSIILSLNKNTNKS